MKIKMKSIVEENKASAGVLLDQNYTGTLTCEFAREWSKDGHDRTKNGTGSMLAYFNTNEGEKLLNVSKLYVMAREAKVTQLATDKDEFVLDQSIKFEVRVEKGSYKSLSVATAAKAKK